MSSRRDFLKQSILLSASTGISSILPTSIQKALAIDPEQGSTYLDAEHIVVLMQENRSFDHCFGTLKGVRGFNDPRAVKLPNGLPIWMQSFNSGNTVTPFRLNIKDTKATWMGSLPHSRPSQVDAWNGGRNDRWLEAKRSGNKEYANMPLTMGYYNRDDLPFDYALADAFTVCDHNFCSLMGPTTPNRSYFMTGTIQSKEEGWLRPNITNRNYAFGRLEWETFPEVLQKNDIDWKFYQNDLYVGAMMTQEERDWLLNFGCNILEFWKAFNVKFFPRYVETIQEQINYLQYEITYVLSRSEVVNQEVRDEIVRKRAKIKSLEEKIDRWNQENFNKLSPDEKELFHRAFITNKKDGDYRSLTTFKYKDQGSEREVTIPKGDILYQFRKDVEEGKLATVNWLAAPKYFSNHPTVPWYGTWYTSEIINILTQNPDVWRKTIFILTYDENDGYFDHIPPFTVHDPKIPNSGKVSEGIDVEEEWIREENEVRNGTSKKAAREAPIGLGFRVPMIIASPWSRGGKVCSEIFDHTSTLQFLEHFINKKFNKKLHVEHISDWRRTICGNLTSVFSPFEESEEKLPHQKKEMVVKNIYNSKFKQLPNAYKKMSFEEAFSKAPQLKGSSLMPEQEKGTKIACALPYELYVDGNLGKNKKDFEIQMSAGNQVFGTAALGAPFTVYSAGQNTEKYEGTLDNKFSRHFTVKAGDTLRDEWRLSTSEENSYLLYVHGPNGFYRKFAGNSNDPDVKIVCRYEESSRRTNRLSGHVVVDITNTGERIQRIIIKDHGYDSRNNKDITIPSNGEKITIRMFCPREWYDFSITTDENSTFEKRYAGKVETGNQGVTDPIMGS